MNVTDMKIKHILSLLFLTGITAGSLSAQQTGTLSGSGKIKSFTLQQAVDYSMIHNYAVINAGKDLEIAKQKIKEQTAQGLPQVNASIDYQDNFSRPVFILPGELAGKPGEDIPVQFGTKYSGALNGNLKQLIFDGRYFIGLKAARISLERTNKAFFKNKLAVTEQVSDAYFNVLSVEESLRIVDSTLQITRKLAGETEQIYKAGLAEDVDVDQLNLLVANLQASRTYLKNQRGVAMAFLKFYLGLGEKDSVILTQSLPELIKQKTQNPLLASTFNLSNNIDYQTVQNSIQLENLKVKLAKAAFVPSINAIVNYQNQAQRDVWNFFQSGQKWYQSANFGISMSIPILSSGERMAKLKQAKIAYEKTLVLEQQTKAQLTIQYQTLKNDFHNALSVYHNKLQNRKVAEKIYRKTATKYSHGMASSLDLLNTHNQFLNAESDYITAGLNLLKSAEKLEILLTKAQ
jgi:outer membrane protein